MDRFGLRVGATAGWIAFLGVAIGLVVLPMAIAGQPPTITSPAADVRGYFGHGQLAFIHAVSPIIVIAMIPFGLALRGALRSVSPRAGLAADVGLVSMVVATPLYVVSAALGTALVGVSSTDGNAFEVLFRLYSVLYDGGADFLEGAWVGAFSLAMLSAPVPRWLGWLGVAVAVSRFIKALAPVVALPGALAIVGGVAFLVWFGGTVIWLSRAASPSREAAVLAPSPVS